MGKKNKTEDDNRTLRISARKLIASLALFWMVSLIVAWHASDYFKHLQYKSYDFLNPSLRVITPEENSLEQRQKKLLSNLTALRQDLNDGKDSNKDYVAFYVEDLNSGSWTGWQEREPFIAASLLKTPIAIAALKKVDLEEWSLSQEFVIIEQNKDKNFGNLWKEPEGTKITLDKLIGEMLQNSDNTAALTLFSSLELEELDNVFYHIGIVEVGESKKEIANNLSVSLLSAREEVAIFRALYNSTFLTRRSSNYILEKLSNTKFDDQTRSSIPQDIRVAHKIGNFYNPDPTRPRQYHDCGIVYFPDHPYVYCIMTKDKVPTEAEEIITGISKKIFNYFQKNG